MVRGYRLNFDVIKYLVYLFKILYDVIYIKIKKLYLYIYSVIFICISCFFIFFILFIVVNNDFVFCEIVIYILYCIWKLFYM